MEVIERLKKLRALMKKEGIHAYIVPSDDFHQSEYVSDYFKERTWISGFTGSAGTVVITLDKAGLWTDGRYYIQAAKELNGSGIELFKGAEQTTIKYDEWIIENVKEGSVVAFDGRCVSCNKYRELNDKFKKHNISINMDKDLIGGIWEDRPSMPSSKVFIHDVKFCGKDRKDKIKEVRENMIKKGAEYFILSSLDDIAWVLNVRGRDVNCTPVTLSYCIISLNEVNFYVDKSKLEEKVFHDLIDDSIIIKDYDEVYNDLKNIKNATIIYDDFKINSLLSTSIDPSMKKIEETNITTELKAIKNDKEIECLKSAYKKDGVALVKFMNWLEKSLGSEEVTELTASEKLLSFRAELEYFVEPSFNTIAGYKDHAAMMHYSATEKTAYKLEKEGMFLVDSGGQYYDGTTDTTRTIVLGELTEEQKIDFTLVLKGMIDLTLSKFLYGTSGSGLDILVRKPLWDRGIDYKCGTGHGVGFFLNVHEGPQNISPYPKNVRLEEGMILTDEPGVYKEGKYGIRTENTLLVKKYKTTEYGGKFMEFETLTRCPIDILGIKVELLSEEELNWLNGYHKLVYRELSPYLNEEEKEYLKKKTMSI